MVISRLIMTLSAPKLGEFHGGVKLAASTGISAGATQFLASCGSRDLFSVPLSLALEGFPASVRNIFGFIFG